MMIKSVALLAFVALVVAEDQMPKQADLASNSNYGLGYAGIYGDYAGVGRADWGRSAWNPSLNGWNNGWNHGLNGWDGVGAWNGAGVSGRGLGWRGAWGDGTWNGNNNGWNNGGWNNGWNGWNGVNGVHDQWYGRSLGWNGVGPSVASPIVKK